MEITAQTVESFFSDYSDAWSRNDATAIKSFWDTDDIPLYIPEEIDGVYVHWDQLNAYWQHNEGFHEAVSLKFREFDLKPLRGGDVMVAMRMRWDIAFTQPIGPSGGIFPETGNCLGGDNHVVTVLRLLDGKIRLTAWIETPMAPISYVQQLYRKDVTPGFPP